MTGTTTQITTDLADKMQPRAGATGQTRSRLARISTNLLVFACCPTGKSGDHFSARRSTCPVRKFRNRMRLNCNFPRRFNLICPVQSRFRKYSALIGRRSVASSALFRSARGAYRHRHERWARNAMDVLALRGERRVKRTAKSCGPDAPTLASSFAGSNSHEATVATKPGHRGRARRKPLKPLRREGRTVRRTCGD
jgi:hypothetical protein